PECKRHRSLSCQHGHAVLFLSAQHVVLVKHRTQHTVKDT
ncbi:unnamed protein product, partial [Staurois parvus]